MKTYTVEYFVEAYDPRERGWWHAKVVAETEEQALEAAVSHYSWRTCASVVRTEKTRLPLVLSHFKDWNREGGV